MTAPPKACFDRILFRSPVVTVGRFECHPSNPSFTNTGPTAAYLAVFPRTAVTIAHEGAEPILADPSVATLYNRAQAYRRAPISPEGDRCEWIALSDEMVRDLLRRIDARAADSDRPIRFTHAPCPDRLHMLERLLVRAIAAGEADALEAEELALLLFGATIRAAYVAHAGRPPRKAARQDTRRAHRAGVDCVRAAISTDPGAALTLSDAARIACMSPCHLSRLFAEMTGQSLSSYRNDIRLRVALERVVDAPDADLTSVAIEAGFSSHSHFTNRFRSRFGVPPSSLRRSDRRALLREIRKSVQADAPRRSRSSTRGRRSAA